jgi:hypothetical protein
MGTREVLQLGFRWKIENGRQIRIWKDSWLPTHSTFKVVFPKPQQSPYIFVSDLIDEIIRHEKECD